MKMNSYRWLCLPLSILLVACSGKGPESLGSGAFEADEVVVSAQTDGEILRWHGEEGMNLNEGDEVGLIDSTMLHLKKISLEESGSGVMAASPDVTMQTAVLEQKIKELKRERTRTENLIKADVAPQKQLDDINAGISQLESQLAAQRSMLNKNKAQIAAQGSSISSQVALLNDQIRKCRVQAPISGVILQNYVHQGELAGAGRPLFSMASIDTLTLRAYVVASDLARVKVGDELEVRVDGEKGEMKEYRGHLIWISDKAEFTPKAVQTKSERDNLVYAVKVAVPNDGYLRIGMYGELLAP